MFEALFTYINKYASVPLSASEFDAIKAVFISKKIKRKHFFLQEGDLCKYFAFIVKGAMRQYLVDEDGAEHMVHLGIENWWMGDRESWVMHSPSNYFIETWEDCELLLITRYDTLKLMKQHPAFNEMVRKFAHQP